MDENIKNDIKAKIDRNDDDLAKDLAEEQSKDLRLSQGGVTLSESQMFDALELCSYAILQNLRRKQCIEMLTEFLDQHGINVGRGPNSVSHKRLIKIYTNAKNHLYRRSVKNVEKERDSYVRNLHRLALKSEASLDFSNAIKCYKELAEVTGVFKKEDSSQIVLNFSTVPPKNE